MPGQPVSGAGEMKGMTTREPMIEFCQPFPANGTISIWWHLERFWRMLFGPSRFCRSRAIWVGPAEHGPHLVLDDVFPEIHVEE